MKQHQVKHQQESGRHMMERSSKPRKISLPLSKQIQIYEYLWMVLSFGIIAVTVLLFNKVNDFQTHPFFLQIKKGNYNDLPYSIPIAIFFIVVDWIVHSVFDKKCDQHYIDREKYPDPETRRKRCETLVKWAYSMSYYLFSSLWAFFLLKEAGILPSWLGGFGVRETMPKYRYLIPMSTEEMKYFYVIQFGKHFGRFINHCFIRREGNFYQYALHHGLSSVLISFSYLTNQWLVGILVLFIHDLSEIILMIGRGYGDYKRPNRLVLYTAYLFVIISWATLRIYSLLFDCIMPCYGEYARRNDIGNDIELQIFYPPGLFMIIMMVILLVMQIFWGILIYTYIVRRIYKESIQKVKAE